MGIDRDFKRAQKRALEKKTGKKLTEKQYDKLVEMAQSIVNTQRENFKKSLKKENGDD